ncbi:MAG: transposase domain-containing protein, partial [Lachnospiraceae bacterium]|nr:transposase domain-containing protein [Lachnospiraceae bacterium]
LYSIVETAKANDLKVYDYLEFLLAELPKHVEDTGREFLKDLLPWSETVQEKCSNRKKS